MGSVCVALSVALWGASARADGPPPDKAACLDASSQAQGLRDAHKLLEARAKLRVCAQQACPAVVQKDCLTWIDAVEQSLPTVVIAAKDGTGRDLFDVKVTADGQPLTTKLTGDAIAMNPGPHAFHFETADGVVLDQQVMVREGVKNQSVAVVLGQATGPAAPTPPTANPAGQPDTPPDNATSSGAGPWRTVGWITAGVGVVGLGLGTVFGVMAMSDKNAANCDASNACQASSLDSANSAATVSTVGFIAGGVLLAGGVALVLFAPKGDTSSPPAASTSLRLSPMVGGRDGGLLLRGAW
jgi:hypothetical protein